jgi:hypothetical protein
MDVRLAHFATKCHQHLKYFEENDMKHYDFDFYSDGAIHSNGLIGLVSRTPFDSTEIPATAVLYLLHKRKREWVLEKIDEETVYPSTEDMCGFAVSDIPTVAFICFVEEPEFDYLTFEDDDTDTYLDWNENTNGSVNLFVLE